MEGVLVIAHGSSNEKWVHLVDEAVSRVSVQVPVRLCFLEMVAGRTILDGILSLEKIGVTSLIAVPLFVSSGSTHIQEIRYLLGLSQDIPYPVKTKPLKFSLKVEMVSPMDDHPFILEILKKRLKDLSNNPREEKVCLVGHGSNIPEFNTIWESKMNELSRNVHSLMGFRDVFFATLLPDTLKEKVTEVKAFPLVVLPLFLSEGYFTNKVIPSRLKGIPYRYDGRTYLPDPFVSKWIEAVVIEKRESYDKFVSS